MRMSSKRLALLVIAALSASACGGGAATPGQGGQGGTPRAGGVLTVGLYQEPESLNPFLAVQTASRLVRELTVEGLLDTGPGNDYVPALAGEVPTTANGGISADGKTITYKLRPDVTWSDKHPVTSADVRFTWQTIMAPGSGVNSQTGYDQIERVDTPDERTAVVTFKQLYAPALSLFSVPTGLLPAHALTGQQFTSAAYNRKPEGTGPFVLTQWASGDSIVFDRNPTYREQGRPYLDRVVFRLVPSREVGIARLRAGEVDVLWDLIETQLPEFEKLPGVTVQSTPSANVEYLGLNTGNPVLADLKVRQAIAAAVDRKPIVDNLLYGKTQVATSPIGLGWAAPSGLSLPPFDPARANQLLDEAGWRDSNGDGIRDKAGQALELRITTPTGSQTRDLTEQLLQSQLQAVGVRLTIANAPSANIFAPWEQNGLLKRGQFDIVEDTWGADFDPDDFLSTLFLSSQIPTAQNSGQGFNFFRLNDPALDQAIMAGRSTIDRTQRAASYRTAVERIAAAAVYIPLYNRAELDAFSSRVRGYQPNSWDEFTWNVKDWWLAG